MNIDKNWLSLGLSAFVCVRDFTCAFRGNKANPNSKIFRVFYNSRLYRCFMKK